jgi:hypothetical protein
VRCKAGGWKCIRTTRAEVECKRTSSSNSLMTMDTVDEEDDDSPSSNNPLTGFNSFSFPNSNTCNMSAEASSSANDGFSGQLPRNGDATMAEDQSLSWLSMDLDSLLGQSLPPLDMSLYQSMGDLAPIHSNTVPYGQDDFSSYLLSISGDANSESTPTNNEVRVPQSLPLPITPQVELMLSDFCKPTDT